MADTALPGVLDEIAIAVEDALGDAQAGIRAALAVARARGGQKVRFHAAVDDNPWLVEAVGREAAAAIVDFFSAIEGSEQVIIPTAGAIGFNRSAAVRRALIEQGLKASPPLPINEIAKLAGCSRRYVFYRQAAMKAGSADRRQLSLFRDEDDAA